MNIFEFFTMMYEEIHPNFCDDYEFDKIQLIFSEDNTSLNFFEICREFFEQIGQQV